MFLCLFYNVNKLSAQNKFGIQFFISHGNTRWQYDEMQLAETGPSGDTLNMYEIIIHGNSPTLIGNIILDYEVQHITFGFGFSIQHYFINEFITDAIFLEASRIYIPVVTTPYNNPQPTHFKFYPYFEYSIVNTDKFDVFISASGGTFLTRNITVDSLEGARWFVNSALGLKYLLNENWTFVVSPAFDYTRVNFNFLHSMESNTPFLNIYSFYTSIGIKYDLHCDK